MTTTTTNEGDTMKTVRRGSARGLFDEAFSRSRDPRSDAYKAGVLYVLRTRVDGAPPTSRGPYPPGSAEADAYSCGCSEGHRIADQVEAPVRVVRR
jgi:hypothetical protein